MKICTITCHNCYNYGAILQTYALQQYLLSTGHENEVIDYVPDYMDYRVRYRRVPERWNSDFVRKLIWCGYHHVRIASFHSRRVKFDNFLHSRIKLTKRYTSYTELVNDPPKAEVYLCGSDQIWNGIDYKNGKDPAFFLQFGDSSVIRASYAASFGRNELDNRDIDRINNSLRKFNYISTRENSGVDLLNQLGFRAEEVVDPVFLLNKTEWERLAGDKPLRSKPYILVYALDSTEKAYQLVSKYLDMYQVISIGEVRIDYDGVINDSKAGPEDFLNYIKYADLVITNSFHCVAYSLIFNKKFVTFDRNTGISHRVKNLLKRVDLSDYALNNTVEKENSWFDQTNYVELINKSKSYLSQIMEGNCNAESAT